MQWLMVAFVHACRSAARTCSAPPPAGRPAVPSAFGPTAWILLGVLAVMLVATLWERWRTAELVAVLLVAATLPCLIAGRFAPDLAVASALRWALAIGFRRLLDRRLGTGAAGCSGCRLARVRQAWFGHRVPARRRADVLPCAPRVARGVLLATMVLPVLAITVMAAALQIGGTVPGRPACQDVLRRRSGRRGRISCRWHW